MTAVRCWLPAALSVTLSSSALAQQSTTAFVHVNLIRMDGDRVERDRTIVVRGDRIVAIGLAEQVRPPPGARVLDGTNHYLVPGLTDSHVHITTDMPWAPARPGFGDAPLYLAHGVTTVVNLRGTAEQLEWKRRVETGEILGPTIYTAGEFVNEPRVVAPEDVRREVAAQARAGYDLLKFHEIWIPGGDSTRRGLSRESYLSLFESAREAGLPVVGHAPVNLGLDALLDSAGGAVAHIGELNRLYFVLGPRTLAATAAAALSLFLVLGGWVAAAVLGRGRRRPPAGVRTMPRASLPIAGLLMMLVPVFAGGSAVGPGGPFYTSAVWRAATTFSCLAVILLGMLSVVAAARAWREQMSVRSKLSFAAAVMSGSALILLMLLAWLPFLWRNSAWGTGHLAVRLRGAGIAVQSSLVVYELSEPGARERVVREPAFTWLTPRAQLLWRRMIEEPGAGFLPPRFPEFTRRLAGTLHVHGVQILAGTDAMGLPLIVPGSSLLRELHLLHQSGLTPYDVLRTATVAPAAFLGKEAEFGAIAIGRRADLLLLERNPLEDLSALTGLRGVMVRGRWLPRERLDEMLGALR